MAIHFGAILVPKTGLNAKQQGFMKDLTDSAKPIPNMQGFQNEQAWTFIGGLPEAETRLAKQLMRKKIDFLHLSNNSPASIQKVGFPTVEALANRLELQA